MQAKKRYILVFVSCAFLAYCYFGGYRLKSATATHPSVATALVHDPLDLPSFVWTPGEPPHTTHLATHDNDDDDTFAAPRHDEKPLLHTLATRPCRMETCFDFTRCYDEFLVYVYPLDDDSSANLAAAPPISLNYQKILRAITESRYYTADPSRACLFVLAIDTLDRDTLSDDYVRNVPARLHRLPTWNNGRNHILFNLYSGTWPGYSENSLGFNTGEAILAKASMSWQQIRPEFDISIPLFHKQHPLRAGNTGTVTSNNFPVTKKYLLAFKGKR